jgi:hypothetical protein
MGDKPNVRQVAFNLPVWVEQPKGRLRTMKRYDWFGSHDESPLRGWCYRGSQSEKYGVYFKYDHQEWLSKVSMIIGPKSGKEERTEHPHKDRRFARVRFLPFFFLSISKS